MGLGMHQLHRVVKGGAQKKECGTPHVRGALAGIYWYMGGLVMVKFGNPCFIVHSLLHTRFHGALLHHTAIAGLLLPHSLFNCDSLCLQRQFSLVVINQNYINDLNEAAHQPL